MSNKIQSYINSSSPGRNRLPVPKKSFKSVLSQDRNIIVPSKEFSETSLITSELKFPSALKHASTDDTSHNAHVDSHEANSHTDTTHNNHNGTFHNGNLARSEAAMLKDQSRSNSSVEEAGRESRKEAREAFLKSDHMARKFEATRDLPEPPVVPVEKDIAPPKHHPTHLSNGGATVTKGGRTGREHDTYIGFANLPNQVYRKSVKKGFDFTLMLIGESGLGKSTLINSMFLTDIYNHQCPGPSQRPGKTLKVEKMHVLLCEGGVQLRLAIVDTPGFGDCVNNSDCWKPILEYIDEQYDSYLNMESRVVRQEVLDTRVHCCLYFISPNGHGLRQLDVECMKQLHEKVNIIPLIAKADSMTLEECRDFKKTITNEIEQHKIKIYEFPECEDEEEQKIMKRMKDKIPFAVVGSNSVVDCGGKKVRARVYPWGTVEVENLEHNDFTALRNMLIRTHLHDLKDVTNNVHYENFRFDRLLTSIGADNNTQANKSPLLQIEEEKREHREKLKRMEVEMGQMFDAKVNERRNKLHESDMELQRRKEQLLKSLQQQEAEYEEMRRNFNAEKDAWEDQNKHLEVEANSTLKKKKTLFN